MKEALIAHLKTKSITSVSDLWGEAKSYYKDKLIEMGGSYASFGDYISVTLAETKGLTRFNVRLEEIKGEITQIKRRSRPLFVKKVRVGDLDIAKCSPKFLVHNFDKDKLVNVKCYPDGTIDLRGKREEYRIIVPDGD